MSWNGSTEVVAWRLRAGKATHSLQSVAVKPKRSFETGLDVPAGFTLADAIALDRDGHEIGRSRTIRV